MLGQEVAEMVASVEVLLSGRCVTAQGHEKWHTHTTSLSEKTLVNFLGTPKM